MRWERDLLAFLRRELAPSPARWRAALRTTVVVAIAITLLMALHVPEGEFLLVTLFVLTPADAGASLDKARLRACGTLAGGLLGLVGVILTVDKPWLFVPFQALVFWVAMFLARTTTASYAFVLGAVTFAMVLPLYPTAPAGNVETALWRTLLTTLGVLMATGAQLLLWPDDPEVLLLDDLAGRVRDTETLLARLGSGDRVEEGVAVTGVTAQLDLLKNAETRSRWLRQRHTEQIALIATVQLLVTAARRLTRLAGVRPLPAWARPRIDRVGAACAAVRAALAARRPVDPPGPEAPRPAAPAGPAASDLDLEVVAAVEELERALTQLPAATGFLAQGPTTTATAPAPVREPVAEQGILTPACSLANVEAIRFALKVALATSICALFMEATHLPGLSTSLITCAVIAQSFVGAGLRKAALRVAGAIAGGAIALLIIVALMPNLGTLAPYLVVATAAFGAAAWLVAGSSRIGYVGLQMAIVLALTIVQTHAPTTDLAPPTYRLLGVLLGILVMGAVDVALWPVFGETALRRTLAVALRQMAELHRVAASGDPAARRQHALGIYRTLGDALAMHDDLEFEPGRGDAPQTHGALLRVVSGLERLFLDLLALARHRPTTVSSGVETALARLDADTTAALESLARRLEGGPASDAALPAAPLDALRTVEPLREFTRLYDVVLEALGALAGDLAVLERADAPLTAAPAIRPSPPSHRPRTPAPQPS